MNSSPKISVILPAYNDGAFIAKTIKSILNQTFQDFDLIISDDGSDDNSIDIIKSFDDPRITFNSFQKNTGEPCNFKYCIDKARGEYIAVAHSDDYWDETKLEKQLAILESDKNIKAVFTLAMIIDENDTELPSNKPNPFVSGNRSQEEWIHYFFFNSNCLCHPSVMINAELYREITRAQMEFKIYKQLPDFTMWLNLIKKGNIHVIQEKLTYFRMPSDNSTVSSYTYNNVVRIKNESYFILRDFFHGMDKNLIRNAFSDCFIKKGELNDNELLCEIAFLYFKIEGIYFSIANKIAIEKIYELLTNIETRDILEQSYHFNSNNFKNLTQHFDIFMPYEEHAYRSFVNLQICKKAQNIAMYGTGKHAVNILNLIRSEDNELFKKVKCCIDKNTDTDNADLSGLPIMDLHTALKCFHPDLIIICSLAHRDVIYDRLKDMAQSRGIKVVKLFEAFDPFA